MLFRLDFQSAVPIYRQSRDQVVRAVAKGELVPGEHPLQVVDTRASEQSLPKPIGLWTLVLLWVCGRWTFRRREDMVTGDSDRNQTLFAGGSRRADLLADGRKQYPDPGICAVAFGTRNKLTRDSLCAERSRRLAGALFAPDKFFCPKTQKSYKFFAKNARIPLTTLL